MSESLTRPARRCGAVGLPDGRVLWRVWAPRARAVGLVLINGDARHVTPMQPEAGGHFTHEAADVTEGQRYAYRLDGGPERADPCSLWQPDGVDGPSAVVRPDRFPWTDGGWRGVDRRDLVLYELHVGTFTPEGTFDAAIPRLDALRDLGVTAVEIMPVGQFPGARGWGYDGVGLYAAQDSYGGPHGLQRLVDACHRVGLAAFLDVVYNHFGPEGNYTNEFAPYLTDQYKTPWGSAVNYDGRGCDGVRDFVLDNVRMWLDEFHVDGLRLDAVHAIYDCGARPILRAIQATADDVARRTGRRFHVIAESDLNDPRLVWPAERGGYGLDAHWADDFHHALHAVLTGERTGYYQDYGSLKQLAEAYERPYLFAWSYSPFRGRKHGAPADGVPHDRFVVCAQNHDQVGNRASGDRLCTLLLGPAEVRLTAALLLLSPYVPLLFMGEEYGEEAPFPYFCSFRDEALVEAVRRGREAEFAELLHGGHVPDPHAEETFRSAKLTWSWPDGTPRAGLRLLHRDLLTARREWPELREPGAVRARLAPDADTGPVLEVRRGVLVMYFNLSAETRPLPEGSPRAAAVLLSTEGAAYGGGRGGPVEGLLPWEAVVFRT